jgi:hypothetical protein
MLSEVEVRHLVKIMSRGIFSHVRDHHSYRIHYCHEPNRRYFVVHRRITSIFPVVIVMCTDFGLVAPVMIDVSEGCSKGCRFRGISGGDIRGINKIE